MGQFVLKEITCTLDPKSIRSAIKEVRRFQEELAPALAALAAALTMQGIEVAKMTIAEMGAADTGALSESIEGWYNESEHVGMIFSTVPYAMYVEYGTGIVGESNPHPDPEAVGWEYDVNSHGENGWWYPSPTGWYIPKDGVTNEEGWELAWTKGMPARPFMYETMRDLEAYAEEMGGRIIAEYFP